MRFDLDKFHTFGWNLLNNMKTILSIFIKLKLISFRKIILIMVEKMLKIGSHLHSLKADFKKELALCNGGDQTKIHYMSNAQISDLTLLCIFFFWIKDLYFNELVNLFKWNQRIISCIRCPLKLTEMPCRLNSKFLLLTCNLLTCTNKLLKYLVS